MIYTLTLNPSIDYYLSVARFAEGTTMRSGTERMEVGGKGINVSLMLRNLLVESEAILCTAGFTGAEIERLLVSKGLSLRVVHLAHGNSRINVKVKSNLESEINGAGPELTEDAVQELKGTLAELTAEDTLVISGSVSSIDEITWEELLQELQDHKVSFVCDMTGSRLKAALRFHPMLVKPNLDELKDFFGVEIKNQSQVETYALKLHEMGAEYVLVSLGEAGAVMVSSNGKVYSSKAPEGTLRSSVGAGDSMVAGFLAARHSVKKSSIADREQELLHYCVACGSATAFSDGFAQLHQVEELMERMR